MADPSADHASNEPLPPSTPIAGPGEDTLTPSTTRPDVTAPSSEASRGEPKKETLLEAVLKAVEPKDDDEEPSAETPPTSESATSPTDAKGEGDKGPDLATDPTAEELAGYKKSTRERIEQLLGQRNAFKAEAEVTQTLRNFLVTNDIAREDFQLTLDLSAAMRRGDFKTFLEGVGPYVQLATQALGITLPPDLDQEVRAQRLTFDAAAQMSRDRYARALAEQRATRVTEVANSHSNQAQQQQFARSIEQTVSAWETGIRQSDPDYGRKEETVRQLLWSVVHEQGPPRSPEHAVEMAKEAYSRANNTVRHFASSRQATKPVPSSIGNRAASGARPEPKSMMEAAELGLARARGA
jgi:hypothetical protein